MQYLHLMAIRVYYMLLVCIVKYVKYAFGYYTACTCLVSWIQGILDTGSCIPSMILDPRSRIQDARTLDIGSCMLSRLLVPDPEFWILDQDPESFILEPGSWTRIGHWILASWIQDPGSWIQDALMDINKRRYN